MDSVIFRNDDVNPNTNFKDLSDLYCEIGENVPGCRIISCFNFFARTCESGSVYSGVPFKDKPVNWFYDVNRVLNPYLVSGDCASHGLFHIDHTKVSKDTQEMSILSSCRLLKVKTFVPPFNRFNEDTIDICKENDIWLVGLQEKWKSIEHEEFDPNHKYWYFHSWRFNSKIMGNIFNGYRSNLGQLQRSINGAAR